MSGVGRLYKVGLIGAGNMGEAMLGGWLESDIVSNDEVVVCEAIDEKRRYIGDKYGVATEASIGDVPKKISFCFLAVKPQDSDGVLVEISKLEKKPDVIISIAAGLSRDKIKRKTGGDISVVRVMPNMAAKVKCAISAYSLDSEDEEMDRAMVEKLLGGIGEVVLVKEELMDLVTAVSGSGPAYFYYMVEALEKAGIEYGLDQNMARKLAEETYYGSAMVMKKTGMSAGELRKAVSSPGGTTIEGLKQFDNWKFDEMVSAVVYAAKKRAAELAG